MKKVFVFTFGLFSFLATLPLNALVPRAALCSLSIENIKSIDENPLGVWAYTVSGAGSEYEKGVMFIRFDDGAYAVDIQLSNGTLTGHDVQVDGNIVKFNINIEGIERVSVVLQVMKDEISGEVFSSKGTYKIAGFRKLPEE